MVALRFEGRMTFSRRASIFWFMDLNNDWRSLVDGLNGAEPPAGELPSVVIGKANVKLLNSLGHVFGRYVEAQKGLMRRGVKEAAGLQPWLEGAPELSALPEQFQLVLKVQSGGVKWLGVAGEALEIWNAAIWPALLRLPILRSFWEQQLRGNVRETLLQVMPKAWLVDPTPLPPGSVVAGLEVADWHQLGSRKGRFATSRRWEVAMQFTEAGELHVAEALAAFPKEGRILTQAVEDESGSESWIVLASYQMDERGTSLVEAKVLNREEDRVKVSKATAK